MNRTRTLPTWTVFQDAPEPFAMPTAEDLAALSAEALDALELRAVSEFDTLFAAQGTAPNAEAVTALTGFRNAIVACRTERGAREAAATELSTSMAELQAPVAVEVPAETPEPDAPTDAPPAPEAPVADAPAAPAAPVAPAAPAVPAAVVAAAPRPVAPALAAVARVTPRPVAPLKRTTFASGARIIAAVDSGYPAGSEISMLDMGRIAETKFGALPQVEGRADVTLGIGMIKKPELPTELVATGGNDWDVIDYAASESRLEGGSLTAAGANGWCAPSEVWYDLAPALESGAGLIQLPTVGAPRGGVQTTPGPQFCDFYSGTGFFTQTEAQAIANTQKPAFAITCPNFTEARLDAYGLSLTAGILQNKGYPEYVSRFIQGSLVAHAHRMNAARIQAMVGLATAVSIVGGAGATADTLGAVELQIIDLRYLFRMSEDATMEVVLPFWVKGVIRSDLAKRNGVEMTNVTNAMIDAHFANRGARVQYVYDWQDAMCGTIDSGSTLNQVGVFGGATPMTAWPATVKALIYPAGTFVNLENDVITLDAVYDSVLFRLNRYSALFTEEAFKVILRAYTARLVTIPVIASGITGGQQIQTAGSAEAQPSA